MNHKNKKKANVWKADDEAMANANGANRNPFHEDRMETGIAHEESFDIITVVIKSAKAALQPKPQS